jgi:hypothetical protein
MPIRLNLLAEEQHLAEMRRRDPVKRAAWLGGFLVALMLGWWGWLMFAKSQANAAMARHEANFKAIEAKAKAVSDQIKRAGEIEKNIHQLNRLGTNRVLWASCLNALQECAMDQVVITRVRADQSYTLTPAVVNKAEPRKSKPATATERIVLVIAARDYGRPADENSIKFKEKLQGHPWFKQYLAKENPISFKGFSNPTPDKEDPGKVFISFTMECAFAEQVRLN